MPRVSSLYPMASAGTEEWGCARARLPAEAADGNPGENSSESPEGVEARQEDHGMPKTASKPAMLGNEAEVSRLADEVAKRGRKGQQNPAGARTSGLRWDGQRPRSAHRGGE